MQSNNSDSDSDSVCFKSKGEPYLDAVVMYLYTPGAHAYSYSGPTRYTPVLGQVEKGIRGPAHQHRYLR